MAGGVIRHNFEREHPMTLTNRFVLILHGGFRVKDFKVKFMTYDAK